MFTAAKLKSAATYLSQHLTANDYYSEDEKVTGYWMGEGAKKLGLHGKPIGAKDAAFEALRVNIHPQTGSALTQRTGAERIAFYDFQVSVPKSVSLLAVSFGDDRLRQAHEHAVSIAFCELERYAARRFRTGLKAAGDENLFTGNLVAAAFTHDASRALDAQLHTHLVCANATYDAQEQQWYALQNREMYAAIELAGRIFQNELARQVISLGYDIRLEIKDGKIKGFEIVGTTAHDREIQSRRNLQINAAIEKFTAEHGHPPTNAQEQVMARITRTDKLAEITTAEVRAGQLARYAQTDRDRLYGLIAESKKRGQGLVSNQKTIDMTHAAVKEAIEHIAARDAVFDGRTVLARILRENPGTVDLQAARDLITSEQDGNLATLHEREVDPLTPPDRQLYTTRENLRLELEAVEIVVSTKGKYEPFAANFTLSDKLTSDQRQAVQTILSSRDGVIALRGPAGTGKTTTLNELERIVQSVARSSRLTTLYVAPTHPAKGVLQDSGFEAQTVARLLVDLHAGRIDLSGKLLVVDEAGMQSTRDGHKLLKATQKAGARVLFVGDEKQIPAVEAGDFMSILRRHAGMQTTELSTIFRQRANPAYLAAMEKMATGNVKAALGMLDEQGRIKEAAGEYLAKAAEAYCAKTWAAEHGTAGDPSTVALVAPTWREIDQLTNFVRKDRQGRGQLTGPEVKRRVVETHDLTAAERRTEHNYETGMVVSPATHIFAGMQKSQWYQIEKVSGGILTLQNGQRIKIKAAGDKLLLGRRKELPLQVGDKIMLQGNDRESGLTNGIRGVVTGIENDGRIRFREMPGGKVTGSERVIPAKYETFTHGYAMTVHASQGQTVTTVIGAVGRQMPGSLWNVLTSRGRREIEVFVPNKKMTIGQAPETIENRRAALDYAPGKTKAHERARQNISPLKTVMRPQLAPQRGLRWQFNARHMLRISAVAIANRFRQIISPHYLAGQYRRLTAQFGRTREV